MINFGVFHHYEWTMGRNSETAKSSILPIAHSPFHFFYQKHFLKIYSCIFLLFCPALFAQDWQISQLDTFFFDADNAIVLSASQQYGFALRQRQPPNFSEKFWIEGNIFHENSPMETDLYLMFGDASTDSLWAAGYSLRQKQIIFGRVEKQTGGEVIFKKLASKAVEIIDFRKKYVYRIIFVHKTNEMIAEVNGAPMAVKLSFPVHRLDYFGYLLKGKQVRVELLRFGGRNGAH